MWGKPQEEAWQAIKKQLTAACLLTHFDPDKEVILACDASPYGMVLSSRTGQRKERNQLHMHHALSWQQRRNMHS